MNKKITTALLCGSFFTTSAILIAGESTTPNHDVKKSHNDTANKSTDYPVRDDMYTHSTSDKKANTASFEWQANQRLDAWEEVMDTNRERYMRSGRENAKAEKTMKDMDTQLEHWRTNQMKWSDSSPKERQKVATDISRIDRKMASKQQEFDRQVPRDAVDYKSELESTVSQIEEAEQEIEERLAFLNNNEEMLENIQEDLEGIKEEANEHIVKIDEMNSKSEWTQLKSEIDSWMNENLNLQG